MFNVDIYKIIDWFIPPRKRNMWRRVWLRSLLAPVAFLQGRLDGAVNPDSFDAARDQIDYKLKHTGQVVYLQKVLNDQFDPTERRITIYNAGRVISKKIFRRTEWAALGTDEKERIYRRAEFDALPDSDKLRIYRRMEGSTAGGFVVDVPFSLTNPEYYHMRSWLTFTNWPVRII